MPDSRKRIADTAFLLALMIYVLVGIDSTPVHADEYMQMSMARDVFYMARGQWDRIAYAPPIQPDTEPYLRIINGTINKTLIGLEWLLNGRTPESLPGIYAWAMPYDWNQRQGNVPSADDLHLARLPSALLTALGVIPVFLLGWQLRLRSLAYPAALLYALHPVILLNGRRAMMEGSLMLTTLLTVSWLVAMIVAEHSAVANGFMTRIPLAVRYIILGLLAGLTVAAKHTGLIVVVSVLLAALAAGLAGDRSWRSVARIVLSGAAALVLWFALNPAYWRDPVGSAGAALSARGDLLTSQEQGPLTYTNPWQRVEAVLVQPFLTPPQYYESNTWNDLIDGQIDDYRHSAVDGWDWGPLVGWALTLLALIGLASLIWDAIHRDKIAWAILIWTSATVLASIAVPLGWQRYYLPLLLVAIILAAMGLGRLLVRRIAEENRVPTAGNVSTA
jgi:4-amino-4-deoxy-L-arabinose transferase-like glycosyltransferase